jgi:hypothetical protein
MKLFAPNDSAFGNSDERMAEHLTVAEAGELLDWLEGHGIQARDVEIESDGYMSVRWQTRQKSA